MASFCVISIAIVVGTRTLLFRQTVFPLGFWLRFGMHQCEGELGHQLSCQGAQVQLHLDFVLHNDAQVLLLSGVVYQCAASKVGIFMLQLTIQG